MARRYHRLTQGQQREFWRRWQAGESVRGIGRMLGVLGATLNDLATRHGGIVPPTRTRAPRVLRIDEREEISRALAAHESMRSVARRLGRAPSTVSREIGRHGGPARYRAERADGDAWRAARRPKRCRLAQHPRLRAVVAAQLAARWAPEQISGWLVVAYPEDPTMRVSHETIYRSLYIQARGVLKKELLSYLRRRSGVRKSRAATTKHGQGHLVDMISIADRPATIEDRAVPGHWEGDLLAGGRRSHIATLVERHSRFVQLVAVPSKETARVVDALIRHVHTLPEGLMTSLTWDRGKELAQHARFRMATNVAVYFCDPHSPWQRGSNENTNGLLRQYFPAGMDLTTLDQRALDAVAWELNTRPRKTLGFRTPAAVLAEHVALTD